MDFRGEGGGVARCISLCYCAIGDQFYELLDRINVDTASMSLLEIFNMEYK